MRSSEESEVSDWCWFKRRVIEDIDTGEPYLVRWTLIQTPWFSIKVHQILIPDRGRDLHDHPWWFLSIPLRGWYEEVVAHPMTAEDADATYEWRKKVFGSLAVRPSYRLASLSNRVRWFTFKRATDAHRIERISDPHPITLVITGPRVRVWGFHTEHGGWVSWHAWVFRRYREKAIARGEIVALEGEGDADEQSD